MESSETIDRFVTLFMQYVCVVTSKTLSHGETFFFKLYTVLKTTGLSELKHFKISSHPKGGNGLFSIHYP